MIKSVFFIGILMISLNLFAQKTNELPHLKISENQRYFIQEDGKPFFWMGDTAWLLFSKLNREEAIQYLDDRKNKKFNVVQVMLLHQLKLANAYGDSVLIEGDISKPMKTKGNSFQNQEEYDYWDHVDFIIKEAEKRGIYMALVPVWGSNVRSGKVSANQAELYSKFLAERFGKKSNIVWLNGGDTRGSQNTEIWNKIGNTLNNLSENQLITFHPFGRMQSSMWFQNEKWLNFNMFQSGHQRYDQDDSALGYAQDNWKYVRDDHKLTPLKPTLDGEPSYEGIPQGLHDPKEPYWTGDDIRRYAYWSVFSGAAGFTYGHNAVIQIHKKGDEKPAYGVREYWDEALNAEGATQMQFLKDLILNYPYLERISDHNLIASPQGEKYDYLAACRGENYALIYTYNGREFEVQLGIIQGKKLKAYWFNPRNGQKDFIEEFKNQGKKKFKSPGEIKDGVDWVLILELL